MICGWSPYCKDCQMRLQSELGGGKNIRVEATWKKKKDYSGNWLNDAQNSTGKEREERKKQERKRPKEKK